jgi:hypothetical protein
VGIRLNLEIEGPITDDDKALLPAATMMLMAITNQALGIEADDDDERPCGSLGDDGFVCVSEAGHVGRHEYRPVDGSSSIH